MKSNIQKINEFYKFLRECKEDVSVIEIIEDFCEEYNYELEEIGDIISDDKYLKDFIYCDCIKRKYFKDEKILKSERLS